MASTTQPRAPSVLGRVLPWAIVGVVLLGVVLPVLYVLHHFAPPLERFQIEFARIELTQPPAHVPSTLLDEVQVQSGLPRVLDLRQPELPARLTSAFQRHPWVASVERVALLPRGRVTVQLVYRRPVLLVEPGPEVHAYLVDRQSVLLPASADVAEQPQLLKLVGAPPPRGPVGQPWGSAPVEAAARLAGLVEPERERLRLTTVLLTTRGLTPELRLRTEAGTEVIWQSLGGKSVADEATPDEKLRRLLAYVAEYGSLDKPAGPYVLDVRPAGGLLRRTAN